MADPLTPSPAPWDPSEIAHNYEPGNPALEPNRPDPGPPSAILENAYNRPTPHVQEEIARGLPNPIEQGIGAEELASRAAHALHAGDYNTLVDSLPELAMAVAPMVRGKGPGLIKRPPVASPAISKGQLFDYSKKTMERIPDVPQEGMVESEPNWVNGTPEWVLAQKLTGAKNMNQLSKDFDIGARMGMLGWYNMDQLRQRFIGELGAKNGDLWFKRFLMMLGATSPQSKPWINARNASYRYGLWRQGEPPPAIGFQPDKGYGHYLNKTHNDKVARAMEQGQLDPADDPKTARFTGNLSGNLEPMTVDIHAMRALGPEGFLNKSGKPIDVPQNAYHYIADIYRNLAARKGVPNAQGQAAVWGGAGGRTGQVSEDPFLRVFEERIRDTAAKTGMRPEDVIRQMVRGTMALRKDGGEVGAEDLLREHYAAAGAVGTHSPSVGADLEDPGDVEHAGEMGMPDTNKGSEFGAQAVDPLEKIYNNLPEPSILDPTADYHTRDRGWQGETIAGKIVHPPQAEFEQPTDAIDQAFYRRERSLGRMQGTHGLPMLPGESMMHWADRMDAVDALHAAPRQLELLRHHNSAIPPPPQYSPQLQKQIDTSEKLRFRDEGEER